MKRRFRTGGLAAWSIHRPIAVSMLALAIAVLGIFSFDRLNIDLLPKLIYPDIRVRVLDPGVPARIMEDQITRQLEEQLAITEDAIVVQSDSSEGRSQVSLSFPYGTDIDVALRDASTRLDRAKRFLPDTIEPPIIYKRDPSQIPVLELSVSSDQLDPVELRSWVDYEFSKWFLTIEGVAAAEIGGGLVREIQIIVDQEKLAAAGFEFNDVIEILKKENLDIASGTLYMQNRQLSTRTRGRFTNIKELARLPLTSADSQTVDDAIRLGDVAKILDTHGDEELRIRLNGTPGIKLSIQKQPTANTVAVVDAVLKKLDWFKQQNLLPESINVEKVADGSTYVRHALRNASIAALSGALLAMLIVYIFIGNIRRTLIISTAIPLAILVTFSIMGVTGLTLNIMSLGGLALGIGLLVDNTIVMLENISRHQKLTSSKEESAVDAAAEITSAITASTTTNLVAVLPFLFIGGLVGLLFSELIITLSAAIVASLLVALTLIPALGAKAGAVNSISDTNIRAFDKLFNQLQNAYGNLLKTSINKFYWLFVLLFPLLFYSAFQLYNSKQPMFPTMDEGQINVGITGEPGTRLEELDKHLSQLEQLFINQPDVETVFVTSGGWVFGRSRTQQTNRGSIDLQLKPLQQRKISSKAWVDKMNKTIKEMKLTGFKVRLRVRGLRGVHMGRGDDDISLRIQGSDIKTLIEAGDIVVDKIQDVPGLTNVWHNYEEQIEELVLNINRERAADLGVSTEDIGQSLSVALNGLVVSDYIEDDRQFDVRIRMNKTITQSTNDIGNIIVSVNQGKTIRLREVASTEVLPTPSYIKRDNQRRIVEIGGTLSEDADLARVMENIFKRIEKLELPEGYNIYDAGALSDLNKDQNAGYIILALALFLVFVVMAVQYESLKNPLVIMSGVPFSLIGVYLGAEFFLDEQLTMPAKIGIIMLAGIVVNNAIVLVEQIEIQREQGQQILNAVVEGARLRLRPILMTTLTTVMGMLPLAIGLGEGSEMLRPMATVIVFGLSFSMLVSLFLIPLLYILYHREYAA
ncbi:MAG: efflux RND transporter permease subunit [Gammaproteobacteria bacterium]|nr:efflux RND transporter permease subunit [Gammaproteobacteria bacterium]